jgi:hypothetical protein
MQRVAAPRRTLAATEPSGPTIRLKHRARTHTSTPPVFAQTVDRRAARPSTRTPCAGRCCASPSLSGTRAELARRSRSATDAGVQSDSPHALAMDGGCCTKGSEKLWNLTGGRRIAIHRSDDVLVPLVGHIRPPRAWVVPSQIDAPDLWVVCATASTRCGRRLVPDRPPPRYPSCCEKWSTRTRASATASSGTTGARASTRRRPARSSSRTRPPSGRGDGCAPLSIATARTRVRSRRRVGRSRSSVHGCATRRHWGWAANGPKPGSRCSGSRPDSHPGTDRQV